LALALVFAVWFQAGPPHLHTGQAGSADAALVAAEVTSNPAIGPNDCPVCRNASQSRNLAPSRIRDREPLVASRQLRPTQPRASALRFLRAPAPPRAPPV
jgi:hypothetical protein